MFCNFFRKQTLGFEDKYLNDKNILKLEIIVFVQENTKGLPIAYVI